MDIKAYMKMPILFTRILVFRFDSYTNMASNLVSLIYDLSTVNKVSITMLENY